MSAGKTDMPDEFRTLAQTAQGMIKRAGPARRAALDQLTQALTTGGVKAKIPAIQNAVSQTNQATSNALRQTSEELANRNVGGPFASRILAGTRMAGEQRAAAIPTEMAQQVIGQMMPFLGQVQGLGMGALGQAGQAHFASDVFNAQQFARLMGDIRESTQGAAMAACLHPNTMIETPDGAKKASELRVGDDVYSSDPQGARIVAKVAKRGWRTIDDDHVFLAVFGPGGEFYVSTTHPLPNGKPITDEIGGRIVPAYELNGTDDATTYTVDIAVDGPTGVYFVNGFELGSTLDPRHNIAKAA